MSTRTINTLFENPISRRIEEVIKVDQVDEQIIHEELAEYIVTDSLRGHLTEILDRYWETPKKPHEGVGVWVSGFFGSGKSSFAKYLGLALENRRILDTGAAQVLGRRARDQKVEVLLKNISEHIPTEAVIFDVSTDRGIRTGNQSITEIMYRLFLQSLGYARDLDLSELEITLEEAGRLDAFKATYKELFNKDWDSEKGKIAIAVQQASRVMHVLDSATYPSADSWRESALKRADITPGDLAKRAMELMHRRRPGKALLFVVDEVGQFVARDVQKMLDLQAVVQNLGRIGRGKMWLVVTSQEKLTELVGGLEDKRVELARLMDRFPLQVHLEPADISEVTSKRVLSKNADAEKTLRALFSQHRGRLTDNTRLTADIKLPELSTEAFVDLYPLLPYQIDLIIQVVSGLRTQGGASKHVGGANRTIIKLAQQLLIHPDVDLASQPIGMLARVDQVYDLVSGNIASEIRGKIDDIGKKVDHPLAQSVAKAICLLQYVRSIHRTPENIAATLHPAVDADSRLVEVKGALDALEKALMVRRGDDGYRIPTPAEDDWERQRAGLVPKPGDVSRLHAEIVTALWQPQPSHNFLDVKMFKAGLYLGGRLVVEGEIPVYVTLAEVGKEYTAQVEEARKRSQTETKAIFWVASLDEAIDRETVELFRSKEILSRKERSAQTKDETALVSEEKLRQRRHQDELRRLLKQALLTGAIFFRGNDRSPEENASDISRAAAKVLAQALPEVFDRFAEAAARVSRKDLDTLMSTENLRGLTAVFTDLHLVRDQGGKPVFNVESGPLAEVLARIENRTSYGEVASGRYLTDEFAQEPFGWDFDVVRLFVIALVRAGKIEATSKGQVIESALSLDARNTFTNNNLFRQASFRPKVGLEFTHLVDAAQFFKEVFGREIAELEQSVVATAIREEIHRHDEELHEVHSTLLQHNLPGAEVLRSALDQMRSIRAGKEDNAILSFNAAYKEMKEAIKRGAELAQVLTPPRLHDLGRARKALDTIWSFLRDEPDLTDSDRQHAERLSDLMAKETFFRELPVIDEYTRALEQEYQRRHDEALQARIAVYEEALGKLRSTPGWEQLNDEQQQRVAAPLASRAKLNGAGPEPIPLLQADRHACPGMLNKAVEEMLRLVDGNRVVPVTAASYFSGGIETEEQLDLALSGLKEHCLELIGAGKKVLVQ
ncbi:MAG: BREX system P-loop protein BrxC [Candidatus Binatia bacterium]